jgi:ABC-2 type transport system permease protein
MTTIKTLKHLLQRELWEHTLIWKIPLGLSLMNGLLALASVVLGLNYLGVADFNDFSIKFEGGGELSLGENDSAEAFFKFFLLGFFLVGQLVALSYVLSALYREREDRSVLFWKSLPISDLEVVLSKAIVGLVIIPISFWLASVFTALLVTCFVWMGIVFGTPFEFSLTTFFAVGIKSSMGWAVMMLGQLIWSGPFFLWVLLVSGTARNAPFIWAFGVPGVGYLVESTMFGGAPVFGWFWARATPLPFSSGNWAPATSSLGLEPMGVLITLVVASGLFVAAVFARRHFREI